jgi:phospholipase/lecithinase/hemolysin
MNFLTAGVLNLPDLGAIPATLGSPEAPQATAYSNDFNAALADMISNFRVEHPEITVYLLIISSQIRRIVTENNPLAKTGEYRDATEY